MPPRPPEAALSAGRKHGRDDSLAQPSQPQTKKQKTASRARQKGKHGVGYNQHRLRKKTDVPEAAQSVMVAFILHLRILWGILFKAEIPALPDDHILAAFNARFSSFEVVSAARQSLTSMRLPDTELQARIARFRADPKSTSVNAQHAARVSDTCLEYIVMLLSHYGLRVWRPDFRQSAYSVYNSAHRFIAVDTFRQLAVSFAYSHLGVNMSFVNDFLLLTKVYDHFVHFYVYNMWRHELKFPGAAQEDASRAAMLERRRNLASTRAEWCTRAGFPTRVVELVGSYDGTSDDEEGVMQLPGGRPLAVFFIRSRPCRSARVTKFLHWVDKQRATERMVTQGKSRRRAGGQPERVRVEPEITKETEVPALPRDVPIDWYDKEAFNSLPTTFRALFRDADVAFPADEDKIYRDHPLPLWRRLSATDWYRNHAPRLRDGYHIPGENDEEDISTENEEQDDPDMANAQVPSGKGKGKAPQHLSGTGRTRRTDALRRRRGTTSVR